MRATLTSLFVTMIVALAVAAGAPAAPPQATTLQKVSSLVQPGIVYLETTYRGRVYDPYNRDWVGGGKVFESTSSCSGFFVNPDGYLVSAGHCVDRNLGREDLVLAAAEWSYENEAWTSETSLEDVMAEAIDSWKVRSAEMTASSGPDREVVTAYGLDIGGLPTGKTLPARVLAVREFEKGDVSLLKIEAENVPVLEIAADANVEVGTEVVSVGYPASVDLVTDQTFDPSFKEGSISSEKTLDGGLRRAYEISAAVAGGMSGGPTVDLRGRVIGVNSFGATYETEAFNFVSPAAEVDELLRDKGVENRLGRINTAYRQGLAAYYAGDREQALARFDEVLGLARSHELAQELRTNALRLPAAAEGGLPLVGLAGAAALLLLIAASAVAILKRRRQAKTPPTAAPFPNAAPNGDGRAAASLVFTSGELAGRTLPVVGQVVLGRGAADVRLDDPQVSGRHASVTLLDGGLVVTDLQSANGTRVNGERIEGAVRLVDGDELQLGQTKLRAQMRSNGQRPRDTVVPSLS